MSQESTNVKGGKLSFYQKGVGFKKDGYCRFAEDDKRELTVAAVMTHAFHQDYHGGAKYKGISAGQKTCISALDFAAAICDIGPDLGPKVDLNATDKKALDHISMHDLKRFAEGEGTRTGAGGEL